jgi:hypothetical protein
MKRAWNQRASRLGPNLRGLVRARRSLLTTQPLVGFGGHLEGLGVGLCLADHVLTHTEWLLGVVCTCLGSGARCGLLLGSLWNDCGGGLHFVAGRMDLFNLVMRNGGFKRLAGFMGVEFQETRGRKAFRDVDEFVWV